MPDTSRSQRRATKLVLLLLVPVLLFTALAVWAFASPVGAGPDDDFHLGSIWCGNGDRTGLCEPGATNAEKLVPRATLKSSCYAFHPEIPATCQAGSVGSDPSELIPSTRGNFNSSLYPPVFYSFMGVFATERITGAVLTMRLVNAAIFTLFCSLLFAALPRQLRPLLVIGLGVTIVPLGMFLIASVNPSGWAVLSAGTLWIALLGYFKTRGWRRASLAGLALASTVIGAGARGDMSVYSILAIGAVVVLTMRREKAYWIAALFPAGLAVLAGLLFLTASQGGLVGSGFAATASYRGFALLVNNLMNLPALWVGSLGTWGLGWLDTTMPTAVWVGTLFVLFAAVFTGLASQNWRKILVLAGGFIALVFIPAYMLQVGQSEVGAQVQARYLLPLLILVVGLALLRVDGRDQRATPFQLWLCVGALSLAHSMALYTNMKRYTEGLSDKDVGLSEAGSWWWGPAIPQPMIMWLAGTLAFTLALGLLAQLVIPHRAWRTNAATAVSD
ncbi:DUF2142 domain-containing protein [Agromyces ramosus]|uniref:DUF2142 domain-containing protein n=1 Tax=Agromyces ramosus TaxID=33879 RepID=UPI0027D8CFFB|nr:DUF2142 domain-containing protein [Agromyces ramosus]